MADYTAGKARILLEPQAPGFYAKAQKAIKEGVGAKGLWADVRMRADASGFHSDAERKLKEVRNLSAYVQLKPVLMPGFRAKAKTDVEAVIKSLTAGIQVRPELDFTRANAQMLAWRRRQEAIPLKIKVEASNIGGVTTGAGVNDYRRRALNNQTSNRGGAIFVPRANTKQLEQDVEDGVTKVANKVKNSDKLKVPLSINRSQTEQDMRRQMRDLQRDLDNNFRLRIQPTFAGVQLRLPLGSLGAQAIPAAVAGIGSLVAALQQLSQVGLLIPGAIAGVGSSIGTLAIGLSGIGDAFKALSDEQDRSAEQASTDAARMATAYDQVKNATLDITDAQKDLTTARKDAKRTLEDLHNEERSSYLSVAEAALDLREAQNELAKGGFKGPLDRDRAIIAEAKAREGLTEAIQRQNRVKEDVADADQKGIDGSDQVVNAQRRLADSIDALAKAQRNLSLESAGAANAHDKAQAALAKLSPEAAKLTQMLFDNKAKWIDLRNTISTPMFRGVTGEIQTLIDASIPLLKTGLGGIADAWNGTIKGLSQNLRSSGTQDLLSRIFGNTEEAQRRFNRAIDPIIRGLGTLAAAGSDALPRLSTALGDVATKFADFISKADDDGRLQNWIDQGIDAFGKLARTVGNIGGIINGISRAFGGTFLNGIESVTKKISDFLNSAKGQSDLREFIQGVKDDFNSWRPVIEDLPKILGTAMEATRAAIQTVTPVLNVFTELLEHCPGLVQAVVTAFIGWNVIRPILSGVSGAFNGVATVLTELGSNFALTKAKAADSATRINTAFEQVGRESGGPAKLASRMSKFATFLGAAGPWGAAIAVAGGALFALADHHDDAKVAAQEHEAAESKLADTLERVSKAAGAATLSAISSEMEDFDPKTGGLSGNVRQAVQSLGINPTEFAGATLPGGEAKAADFNKQFREKVRPAVKQAIAGYEDELAKAGADEDTIVDAYLGKPAALDKFRKAIKQVSDTSEASGAGPVLLSLADVNKRAAALGADVTAAALGGQFLNSRQADVGNAQSSAQAANQTATGGKTPKIKDRSAFGNASVTASTDPSGDVQITAVNLDPAVAKKLAADGAQVNAPYPGPLGPTTVIILSEAQRDSMISYAAGGPTPSGKGKGPTGGHISELHDNEWVLPKNARKMLGDEFLWAITGNRGIDRKRGMDLGGPSEISPIVPPWQKQIDPPASGTVGVAPPAPSPIGTTPGPGNFSDPSAVPTTSANNQLGQFNDPSTGGAGMPPGDPLSNAFKQMFGFGTGNGQDQQLPPDQWLGNFGANIITSLGSTLLDGVLGFFGVSTDNAYFNAFKQTMGFYTGKLGGTDQYVDPYTQGLVDTGVDSFNSYPGGSADGSGIATQSATGLLASALLGDKFKGSGVIEAPTPGEQATVEKAKAPNAQVIGDANIVNYIRDLATSQGLTVGAEGQSGGNPYRSESGSQHEVGRAVDVFGSPEERRQFLLKWNADPRLRAATRMIIDDNNQDQEAYAGKTRAEGEQVTYARGDHPDHIHLALEGVPGFVDPQTGELMAVGLDGGGSPYAPGAAGTAAQLAATGGSRSYGADDSGGFAGAFTAPNAYQGVGGYDRQFRSSGSSDAPSIYNPKYRPGGMQRSRRGDSGQVGVSGRRDNIPNINLGPGGQQVGLRSQSSSLKAPPANYQGGNQQIYDQVYQAFVEAGFPLDQWPEMVQILNHESGWKPTVANPSSGAFGLFQFLGSTQKAYLPDKNPDPYVQGRAGMKYVKDRYKTPAAAWQFWQGHNWYDRGNGLLKRGMTIAHNDTNDDEVVLSKAKAAQAKEIISKAQSPSLPPRGPDARQKTAGPKPPPEADIPSILPSPGISAPPEPQIPTQKVAPAPGEGGGAKKYLLPAIGKGIQGAAATIGSLANTAAAVASFGATAGMGGGAAGGALGGGGGGGGAGGGLSIGGLIQQGGKIVEGIANVGAAFASGFTSMGGTTPNPYGVQLRSNEKPPPTAQDNRRIQYGDNNFASMDEWRRQNQLRDAQDMQADMARL